MSPKKEPMPQTVVAARWSHIVAVLALWIFSLGAVYATVKFQIEDHERRLQKLEDAHFIPGNQGVSRDQFDQMKEDLMRRLAKMEDKLDALILAKKGG